jgi:hypothetical protein
MDTNTITFIILCFLSIILDGFKFEYSFVVKYVIIWYALCILINYDLFI